jgi:putative ABC transport system permease protein
MLSPRKRFTPTQVIPKPQGELPVVYGVEPNYRPIAGLKIASGRFFTADEASHAAPVCVLGEAARVRQFGLLDPI